MIPASRRMVYLSGIQSGVKPPHSRALTRYRKCSAPIQSRRSARARRTPSAVPLAVAVREFDHVTIEHLALLPRTSSATARLCTSLFAPARVHRTRATPPADGPAPTHRYNARHRLLAWGPPRSRRLGRRRNVARTDRSGSAAWSNIPSSAGAAEISQ